MVSSLLHHVCPPGLRLLGQRWPSVSRIALSVWAGHQVMGGLGFLCRSNEVYDPRATNRITFFPLADEHVSGCSLVPCQHYLAVGVTTFPIAVIALIGGSVRRLSADRHDVAISFDFEREGDDGGSFEQLCALLPRCYQKEFSRPISRCRVVKILVNWDWVGPSFSGAFLPQCASFRNSR